MTEEKISKKQCAMLVFGAERAHRGHALINAVGAGAALVIEFLSPMGGAAILLLLLGYNIFAMKKLEQKLKYLRDKYGLG